jgi:hypothetical protein
VGSGNLLTARRSERIPVRMPVALCGDSKGLVCAARVSSLHVGAIMAISWPYLSTVEYAYLQE